jgi:hypothetical protein
LFSDDLPPSSENANNPLLSSLYMNTNPLDQTNQLNNLCPSIPGLSPRTTNPEKAVHVEPMPNPAVLSNLLHSTQ